MVLDVDEVARVLVVVVGIVVAGQRKDCESTQNQGTNARSRASRVACINIALYPSFEEQEHCWRGKKETEHRAERRHRC